MTMTFCRKTKSNLTVGDLEPGDQFILDGGEYIYSIPYGNAHYDVVTNSIDPNHVMTFNFTKNSFWSVPSDVGCRKVNLIIEISEDEDDD